VPHESLKVFFVCLFLRKFASLLGYFQSVFEICWWADSTCLWAYLPWSCVAVWSYWDLSLFCVWLVFWWQEPRLLGCWCWFFGICKHRVESSSRSFYAVWSIVWLLSIASDTISSLNYWLGFCCTVVLNIVDIRNWILLFMKCI
jgi:hypothetical protein